MDLRNPLCAKTIVGLSSFSIRTPLDPAAGPTGHLLNRFSLKNISTSHGYLQALPIIGVIIGHLVIDCLFSINRNVWNALVCRKMVLWYRLAHNGSPTRTAFVFPIVR